MRKVIIFAILLCAVTAFVFANDFTVRSVTGNVVREAGNQRVEIKAGETLANNVVIHTAAGASIVLRDARGRDITVSAERSGTIAELARPGISISGNVSRTNTDAVSRTTTQAGTASARASDAAGADDIAAE
ncbi:MAG: hypothetical protein FWD26_07155 [Treponema sp.]|nr:hypothetical protein [Treponema sp.]